MLRRTGRRVQSRGTLDVGGDSLGWAILRRRGKTRATLSGSAGHDTLEEIGGAMSD
jgi:hypothetical protein